MIDQAPDPIETVRVLKSDFDLLQAAANAAMEDFVNLCELLGLAPPEGMAPRQFMHEVILPMIAKLVSTQIHVDEAAASILERAQAHGMQTKDFGNGTKGLLVGKKQPGLFDPRNREERRRRG